MGIWVNRGQLIGRTSEIIGYKSGLALTLEEFNDIVPIEFHSIWIGNNSDLLRIRSEEYENLITSLLYKVGNISSPSNIPSNIVLFKKYRDNQKLLNIFYDVRQSLLLFMQKTFQTTGEKLIDPTPFLKEVIKKYGEDGFQIAKEVLEGFNLELHRSPWGSIRETEWEDIAQLEELFKSESLETLYGKFLDQRYIDYLSHNFDSIGHIHWRKFEALTCEFFEKQGYYVEIGEGRDDGGIDARVWSDEKEINGPPTILIQCKRHKSKIEKTIVKALWADIQYLGAESGLIVTTSSLSPGAERDCKVRSYPIEQANRNTLKQWVNVMRTPYKGVFMAE